MSRPGSQGQTDTPASLCIRKAAARDSAAILALVHSLELAYPAMDLSCFWVWEKDGEIVAAAELKDLSTCSLLSCVGVREELQGRGMGRSLVDRVAREARFPVYLYTLVPEFFRKAGFRDAESQPPDLPPRSIYGCLGCDPSQCRCMMRSRDDS